MGCVMDRGVDGCALGQPKKRCGKDCFYRVPDKGEQSEMLRKRRRLREEAAPLFRATQKQ